MKRLFVRTLIATLLIPATVSLAQQKMDDMKGMDMDKKPTAPTQSTHKAVGTVTKVDANAGIVTIDHEPVKTLNWRAMTMGFKVTDKSLLNKVAEGKRVEVEFKQVGKDYVITSVK